MNPHDPRAGSSSIALMVAAAVLAALLFATLGPIPVPGVNHVEGFLAPDMAGTFVLQAAACVATGLFFQKA